MGDEEPGGHSLSHPWLLLGKPSYVPSAPALPADHQRPETARDRRGHAADRPLHPDLLAGCGPPEEDGGEVQHGGKCPAAVGGQQYVSLRRTVERYRVEVSAQHQPEGGSLPGCPRGAS